MPESLSRYDVSTDAEYQLTPEPLPVKNRYYLNQATGEWGVVNFAFLNSTPPIILMPLPVYSADLSQWIVKGYKVIVQYVRTVELEDLWETGVSWRESNQF